jgi:hypothetical protein
MKLPLLAHVALVADPRERGLTKGQLGTIVEKLGSAQDEAFLVEFSDEDGQAYAFAVLRADQLMVLRRQTNAAA